MSVGDAISGPARTITNHGGPIDIMTVLTLLQSGGMSAIVAQILPIVAIIAIFYFLVIAPANKQRKKTQEMLDALKKGDRVLTTGGIYGSVQGIETDVVYLKIADNVKIKIARSAVASVLGPEGGE